MTKVYAKVVDGVITEYNKILPFGDKGTSFGVGTTDETMAEFGYLPITGTAPQLNENQRINSVSYVIRDTFVEKVYTITTMTDEELLAEKTPSSITQRQCRLQLVVEGLYTLVNEAIPTLGDTAQIEWEYANDIQRNNPLITAMQQLLGKTDSEMNQFFIDAAQL